DPEPHLQVLLQMADSSITYRRRYPMVVEVESVLEVLVSDETNPRALAFQFATLLQEIDRLQEIASEGEGRERELASRALTAVRKAKVDKLAERNPDGRYSALDELIGDLRWTLYEISDVLTASYLSHLTASRLTVSW
ncbi:MAG TPA: alpha-E domain-containing protein, partial [Terriglobia bacterium]|nr:alpha-E domain-containing protein [Terriglobia bacterium]